MNASGFRASARLENHVPAMGQSPPFSLEEDIRFIFRCFMAGSGEAPDAGMAPLDRVETERGTGPEDLGDRAILERILSKWLIRMYRKRYGSGAAYPSGPGEGNPSRETDS